MKLKTIIRDFSIEKINEEVKILFEFPVKIPSWTDKNLDTSITNLQFTKTVVEKGKFIEEFQNYKLYRYSSGKSTFDCFIEGEFTIAFFSYIKNGKQMEEQKVWQYPTKIGLCREILFNLYFKEFDSVISDMVHSDLGGKYWEKNLEEAEKRGYKCHIYDTKTGTKHPLDKSKMDDYYKSPNIRLLIEK